MGDTGLKEVKKYCDNCKQYIWDYSSMTMEVTISTSPLQTLMPNGTTMQFHFCHERCLDRWKETHKP